MSEKEKQISNGIAEAMNVLLETRGPAFVEGLVAGINIGTAQEPKTEQQSS